MRKKNDYRDLALRYHRLMPASVKAHLNGRGIPDSIICRYRLGWNGEKITIPITNRERYVIFFKFANVSNDQGESSESIASADAYVELYGWERVLFTREQLVICDGELDRLALEARGFAAVNSTDAGAFLREWAEEIKEIPRVYICFRNNESSQATALYIAGLIQHSRVVRLPDEIGEHGTISDYFTRLGKTSADFSRLLECSELSQGTDVNFAQPL